MNAIVPANFGKVSTRFATVKPENDLAAGVQAGFGLIGYKGKVWSIRYRGEDQQLLRDDGDGPRNSIEVVILKGAGYISKIWYEMGYVEGSTAAPDCFSPNGIVPDPASTKRQSNACATCPQNVWGSKISDAGKKGKACGDSKRLAVVPLADIPNETYGGPLLLRVPAASLQDLATFGNKMQNLGYPYYAIATRISFDSNEAYPKFQFNAIRPLTDEEADQVLAMQGMAEVARVLAEGTEHSSAAPADTTTVGNAFEQPPAEAVKPAATPKPAAAKPATPKPEVTPEVTEKPKAGGFGPTAKTAAAAASTEAAKPAPVKRAPPVIPEDDEASDATQEASVVDESTEEGEQSEFELSLDEQLAKLLT